LKRIGLVIFIFMLPVQLVFADPLPIPATPYILVQHAKAHHDERQQRFLKHMEEMYLERANAATSPRRWRKYQMNRANNLKIHFSRLVIKDVGDFERTSDDLDLTHFKPEEVYFGCYNTHISKKVKVIVEPYITWVKVKDAPERGALTRLKEDGYLWFVKRWNDIKYPQH
jgi:hypothetical protein